MKYILLFIFASLRFCVSAQNDSIPGVKIDGNVDYSLDTITKGENINFEFFTDFNKQVTLQLYSVKGDLISTTNIEVYSDKGLALTTRSFESGTYFMRLKLKTKSLVKKVIILP